MITDSLAENSPHKSNECNSSWSLWNLILCTVHHSSCVSSSFCVPKTRVLSSRISCQMPRDRSIRNNVGSQSPSKCPSIDRSLVTAPGSTTVFATVMSDFGHHFGRISHSGLEIILQKLVCRRTIAFRRVESRFPIKARKKLCVFWILIRPDDFEPIQNYVCINVDLLQIDTEIKGVNNIEKHQALINR